MKVSRLIWRTFPPCYRIFFKKQGTMNISYNVHCVTHFPDDYMKYGTLEHVSCFPFENYLGVYVKGRLTGRNKPLEQICRHVSTANNECLTRKRNWKESTDQFHVGIEFSLNSRFPVVTIVF